MNCKPGDLAVIVRGRNTGCFVNVLHASIYGDGWWFVESAGGPLKGVYHGTTQHGVGLAGNIEDARIRPIRAPGITTEEVKELFSPSPAKESEKV